MNLKIDIDDERVRQKVQSRQFGLLVANEWKRLIDPYTPRDTGQLIGEFGNVSIEPFQIVYNSSYASPVYYNQRGAVFVTSGTGRNPYATDHWDEKAAEAGQLNKLYRTINAELDHI